MLTLLTRLADLLLWLLLGPDDNPAQPVLTLHKRYAPSELDVTEADAVQPLNVPTSDYQRTAVDFIDC